MDCKGTAKYWVTCQNLECRSCGVRVGIAGLRGELHRAKDAASTYRLCPHLGTWCVLKFGEQGVGMRGDLERGREREEFRCGVILGFSLLQTEV